MATRNSRRHTKPCIYYQTNSCPLSADDCDYAHVIIPPGELEALKSPQATLRSKPCRFFLAGQCKEGYWCRFRHPAGADQRQGAATAATANEPGDDEGDGSDDGSNEGTDVRDLDAEWKAKPEEHPRYRTRPCRNFLLGKCIYGDRCSYVHIPPTTASTMPGHSSSRSGNASAPRATGMPTSAAFPLQDPAGAPQHHSGSLPPTSRSHAISTRSLEGSGNAFSMASLASGLPAYPSTYQPPNRSLTASHRLSSNRPPHPPPHTAPPYPMYSSPMTIVHVPMAFPMYQQQQHQSGHHHHHRPPQEASRHYNAETTGGESPSRARSLSHASESTKSSSSRNSHFKTKTCKFFAETGTCQKGDNCNFIHESGAREITDGRRRSEGSTGQLGGESGDDQGDVDDRTANYYKINWRVVGGGVMMGGDPSQRRHSEDAIRGQGADPRAAYFDTHAYQQQYGQSSSAVRHHPAAHEVRELDKSPSPFSLDSPKEHSATASTRRSNERDERSSSSQRKAAKAGASKTSGTKVLSALDTRRAGKGKMDWSDDYDYDTTSALHSGSSSARTRSSTDLGLRAKSSPSSPLRPQTEVPPLLFPAESP